MQKYIKIYCDAFGYCYDEFIPSELSNEQAADVHHIIFRSQGGKDEIENLMALTRDEHDESHGGELKRDYLQEKHNQFMKRHENRIKAGVNQ